MQNDKIYSDILRDIKTKSEASEFLAQLDSLSESVYLTDPTAFEKALSTLKASQASVIRRALGERHALGERGALGIRQLREKVLALRPLALTLAFEPSEEFIERLHDWLRENVGEEAVLDFEVKPEIIAGAIISYNGRFIDSSLLNFLNNGGF